MKKTLILLLSGLLVVSCNVSVNQTIEIADHEEVNHSLNSVNGDIIIGQDCHVRGNCRTVNGNIKVGAGSRVRSLSSVNGYCRVDRDGEIRGDIQTVNGWIECRDGTVITGDVESINGGISLFGAQVQQNISVYNSEIELRGRTRVWGDLIIKKSKNSEAERKPVRIIIADESTVAGDLIIKDEDRRVKVYLRSGGNIEGDTGKAEIIRED